MGLNESRQYIAPSTEKLAEHPPTPKAKRASQVSRDAVTATCLGQIRTPVRKATTQHRTPTTGECGRSREVGATKTLRTPQHTTEAATRIERAHYVGL